MIKETFDLTVVPSVRFLTTGPETRINGNVYSMLWNDKSYSYYNTGDFIRFLDGGFEKAPVEPLRSRVNEGLQLNFEYTCSYLAETYFDDILPTFLKVRKFMRDNLSIEIDMKKDNPNFGKKNSFKKS